MFEELNERRKAVERNIAKGFGMDDADLDFEKALEDELEKGRAKKTFAVGDTFTRHGITYKCTGISPNTGRPTWSKVKDSDGIKPEVGKYVDLDSRSSWDDIWDAAKEVAQKWWDEDGSKISGDKTKEEFVKEKMNSICFGFSASVPKKTVIANINTAHQHLAKLKEQKPKKLSELKRGDTVALIMERYNPQLGNYVTIKKVQIEGTTSKSFKVDYMKFDKETGERSDKSSSVYGSSKHYILLPEEVNTHIKDGKWKGDRISGGNPFEDE